VLGFFQTKDSSRIKNKLLANVITYLISMLEDISTSNYAM
jgi:hypothetical protein